VVVDAEREETGVLGRKLRQRAGGRFVIVLVVVAPADLEIEHEATGGAGAVEAEKERIAAVADARVKDWNRVRRIVVHAQMKRLRRRLRRVHVHVVRALRRHVERFPELLEQIAPRRAPAAIASS